MALDAQNEFPRLVAMTSDRINHCRENSRPYDMLVKCRFPMKHFDGLEFLLTVLSLKILGTFTNRLAYSETLAQFVHKNIEISTILQGLAKSSMKMLTRNNQNKQKQMSNADRSTYPLLSFVLESK